MTNHRLGPWLVALLVGATLLLAGLAESTAAARVVGKDGTLYACYRVKGKPKGAVRLVAKNAHCKGSERKVKWAMFGGPVVPGAPGAQGPVGQTGATGPAGDAGQITALTERVEVLESTLAGTVADVNALCTQASGLTTQVNSLTTALGDTALDGIIPIGLELLVPGLPTTLPPFTCP